MPILHIVSFLMTTERTLIKVKDTIDNLSSVLLSTIIVKIADTSKVPFCKRTWYKLMELDWQKHLYSMYSQYTNMY